MAKLEGKRESQDKMRVDMEFTEKEIKALLYAIHYVQDKIKCDGLSKKEVGEFTTQEVKAIERARVKLAKLLEEIG